MWRKEATGQREPAPRFTHTSHATGRNGASPFATRRPQGTASGGSGSPAGAPSSKPPPPPPLSFPFGSLGCGRAGRSDWVGLPTFWGAAASQSRHSLGRAPLPPAAPFPSAGGSFLPSFLPSSAHSPFARRPEATRGAPKRLQAVMNIEHEIGLLVEEIRRLGTKNPDGTLSVKFGVLFADEKCANLFEALVGTLKAAKRRKIVSYPGELLLQGAHDNVDILLLQD